MRVLSVNRGPAADLVLLDGRSERSGIVKRPVTGPVEVKPLGLAGDDQVDLTVHGGLHKAVYMYPAEHYAFWNTVVRQARGRNAGAGVVPYADLPDLPWGALGENLTVEGLLEPSMFVGDVITAGTATLVVTAPRTPCYKFAAVMGFAQAPKLMAQSGYCGWYLEVRQPGQIQAGDPITLTPGDRQHALSIRALFAHKTKRDR